MIRQDETKPDAPVMKVTRYLVSLPHRAMDGPIMKTSATKHPLITFAGEGAAITRDSLNLGRKGIAAPFPDVS